MYSIAVVNQKGGVGKTTVCLNLGAALAKKAFTLLVDLDPQGNLTQGVEFGLGTGGGQLSEAALNRTTLEIDDAGPTATPNMFLLPTDAGMTDAMEARLGEIHGHKYILGNRLEAFMHMFRYCLIDCRPTLGPLTRCALEAADLVLVPITPGRYALEGLAELLDYLGAEGQSKPVWAVLNQVNLRDRASLSWTMDQFLALHQVRLMHSHIRLSQPIVQAGIMQMPVLEHNPRCNGARDFRALARELLGVVGGAP